MHRKALGFSVGFAVGILGIFATSVKGDDNENNLVVVLVGTAVGQMRSIPPTDRGTTMANCFDVNLIDARTDALIGTASDCLADIDPEGDGLALTGTTFFHFKAGTLVSRGRTTVSPISPSALSPMSHITGAIPFPGTNQVLFGTGKFARQMASVRLSGAVNMSNFAARNEIEFSCIFVIHPLR